MIMYKIQTAHTAVPLQRMTVHNNPHRSALSLGSILILSPIYAEVFLLVLVQVFSLKVSTLVSLLLSLPPHHS